MTTNGVRSRRGWRFTRNVTIFRSSSPQSTRTPFEPFCPYLQKTTAVTHERATYLRREHSCNTFASEEHVWRHIRQRRAPFFTHRAENTPTLRIVAPVMGGLFHPRQERSSPQSLYFGALRFRWAITIIENAKQQTIIKKDVTWTPQICRVFSQKERSVLDFLLNFIHHDFVQFGKQHSRYKAILPSIVLSQQCCDAYFIYLTVAKPLWDLTTKFCWNRPPPWTYWLEPPLSKQNLACK